MDIQYAERTSESFFIANSLGKDKAAGPRFLLYTHVVKDKKTCNEREVRPLRALTCE